MLLFAVVAVVLTALVHARVEYQDPPTFFKFPAGTAGNKCLDNQVYKYFDVGETWSPRYSGCKQSKCVRDEDGTLHIVRHSCPNFFARIDIDRVKSEHLHCKKRGGNKNKGYPDCCRTLYCEHYNENHERVELPKEDYPWLPKDQWPRQ